MKKIYCVLLTFVMLTSSLLGVSANSDNTPVPTVYLNGSKIEFNVPPEIVSGSTLVPMRKIFEAMGAQVEWDDNTQSVIATTESVSVSLTIGSECMKKNGVDISLNVAPKLTNNNTMVPLRAIAESFNSKVHWDEESYSVYIISVDADSLVFDFFEKRAIFEKDKKCGYINLSGDLITEIKYDTAWAFKNGFAAVRVGEKYGFVGLNGEEITTVEGNFIYDDVWSFGQEGLARVKLGDKFGFVNTKGEVVIPCQYDNAENFESGKAKVKLGDKEYVINKAGCITNDAGECFDPLNNEASAEYEVVYGDIKSQCARLVEVSKDNLGYIINKVDNIKTIATLMGYEYKYEQGFDVKISISYNGDIVYNNGNGWFIGDINSLKYTETLLTDMFVHHTVNFDHANKQIVFKLKSQQ